MENYAIVSRNEIMKEEFNNAKFSTDKVSEFLNYFMQLLQYAEETLKILGEVEKQKIAKIILNEATKKAQNEMVSVANALYVLTLYLLTMSNWDAFSKLLSVEDEKTAEELLVQSERWFNTECLKISNILNSVQKKVLTLKLDAVSRTYKFLELELKNMKNFAYPKAKVNFKKLHTTQIATVYILINDAYVRKSNNYLERLKKAVKAFCMEVSILSKIDTTSIANFKADENKQLLQKETSKVSESDYVYDNEMLRLKKDYETKLQLAYQEQEEMQEKLDALNEEFKMQHPELSEDALENAFEEYLDSLPESEFMYKYDMMKIEDEYNNSCRRVLAEKEKHYAKIQNELKENAMQRSEADGEISLTMIIKEMFVVELWQNSVINYPETTEERGMLLSTIDIATAVESFVRKSSQILTEAEIKYLTNA